MNVEQKAAKLLQELDITKLKREAKLTDILLQQLLQKLMLNYVVDISEQLVQKQEDVISSYPTELVSSLKAIADLYLKMKEQNKSAKTTETKDSYTNDYVF